MTTTAPRRQAKVAEGDPRGLNCHNSTVLGVGSCINPKDRRATENRWMACAHLDAAELMQRDQRPERVRP
jgi:hypothetical protein